MILGYIHSLISSITRPIAGIKTELSDLGKESQKAFGMVAAGGQTIADSFWSTHSFLESAIQMD
ncbi:hypothetical protein, partial [Xenorhabdus bovienii]|uniref:hypothetical protein n=1 Tax=Xenorhabdus bovienii TaxID=40576 RepID=UPI0023B2327C